MWVGTPSELNVCQGSLQAFRDGPWATVADGEAMVPSFDLSDRSHYRSSATSKGLL